ncbi:MAG: biotin transporter BioY [Bacilli bacterium]
MNKKQFFWYPLSMVLGTIICYFVGTIWYMFQTENSLAYALTVCVVPFIIFDIIKIIVASIVAYIINVKTTLFSSIYSGINKNM